MKEKTQEELIKKAQARDPDAFTDLMMSQMQNMYKTAMAILSNEEDAADAASDTILICWQKLDTLKHPQYFRTWMTRILINKCRDILSKRITVQADDWLLEQEDHEEGYANAEWNEVLASIDERYRLVLILYYVEGYRTSEISKLLNIPENTVCTRLARGRSCLARNCGEEKRLSGKLPGNTKFEAKEARRI